MPSRDLFFSIMVRAIILSLWIIVSISARSATMTLEEYRTSSCVTDLSTSNCFMVSDLADKMGAISSTLSIPSISLTNSDGSDTNPDFPFNSIIYLVNMDLKSEAWFANCSNSSDVHDCINGLGNVSYTNSIEEAYDHPTRYNKNSPNRTPCPIMKCDVMDGSISGVVSPGGDTASEFLFKPSSVGKDYLIGSTSTTLRLIKLNGMNCVAQKLPAGYKYLACKKYNVTSDSVQQPESYCFGSTSCSIVGKNHSLFLLSLSGRVVECLNATLQYLFNGAPQQCQGANQDASNILKSLQDKLRPAVMAAILLYTIFFGINIALGNQLISKGEFFGYVIKIVAVLYFSVGIKDSNGKFQNGIEKYVYGGFHAITNSFSSMVMNSSSGNLCNFIKLQKRNPDAYKDGNQDYGMLALWDSVDCFMAYATGLPSLGIFSSDGVSGSKELYAKKYNNLVKSNNKIANDGLSIRAALEVFIGALDLGVAGTGQSAFLLILMAVAFISFEIMFVILVGIYVLFIVSIIIYFVKLFVLAMVALAIMSYLAVIFVPFALFEHTKPYFDKWLSITLSFSLQPVVVVVFLSLLIGIFNNIVFTDCDSMPVNNMSNSSGPTTYTTSAWKEVAIPNIVFSSQKFYFWYIDKNIASKKCKSSFGYILYYSEVPKYKSIDALFARFTVINNLAVEQLMQSLLKCLMYTFFFYFFAKQIGGFAAQITNGAALPGGSAVEFFNKTMKAIKTIATTQSPGAAAGKIGMSGMSKKKKRGSSKTRSSGNKSSSSKSSGKKGNSSSSEGGGKSGGSTSNKGSSGGK